MNISKELHYLNSYIHNVHSLLKYISEDVDIENDELKQMLNLAIGEEEKVIATLNSITEEGLND
jgi:hypothetical protein